MGGLEVVIEKGDMSDNAEAVGENGKFISITEMAIDIELLGIRRGRSFGGHEGIGHSIRVNIRVIFIVGFEPFDEGIESFRVVFRDIKFNAGSIEGKGVGKGGINGHTDGFREIDQMLKEVFDIRKEFLFKTSEKRGIGSLTEAAKVSKFFGEGKKKNEKGIRRDGKDLLKNKSGEEGGKRISAVPAKRLIKGIVKRGRNKVRDVEMIFKELEERDGVVKKEILTVRKRFF